MGSDFKILTGDLFTTKQGYEIEIIRVKLDNTYTILFNDERGTIIKNVKFQSIRSGVIRNPYHKTVYGVGYLGEGVYKTGTFNRHTIYYKVWFQMLKRCYDGNFHKKQPNYKDVTVCEKWHNYQNFAEWYEDNYNPETMQGWHLDKDILIKGNKIYSPETCCFVPQEINSLFTNSKNKRGDYPIGVIKNINKFNSSIGNNFLGSYNTPEEAFQAYKTAKEQYIKEVADKWKGLISDKVYEAMYNYKVEITD